MLITQGDIPSFINYIESVYNSKHIDFDTLCSLLQEYIKLDYHNSREDLLKKETIDTVFQTLYGITLEKLIDNFKRKGEITKIESIESKLRQRVADLEETAAELREAYWNIKHPN